MKTDSYVGISLLKIAAFLYSARYIAAALLMGPRLNSFDGPTFEASYRYVGGGLTVFAGISAAAGIALLVGGAKIRKNS